MHILMLVNRNLRGRVIEIIDSRPTVMLLRQRVRDLHLQLNRCESDTDSIVWMREDKLIFACNVLPRTLELVFGAFCVQG